MRRAAWHSASAVRAAVAIAAMACLVGSADAARTDGTSSADAAKMQARVEDRLARSASLAGTEIDVKIEGGVATLTGTVGSERERERAGRIARRVVGLDAVKNELAIDTAGVHERRATHMPDDELARTLATSLASETFPGAEADEEWIFGWEVEGEDWEFDIDVDDGHVTLDGTVDSTMDVSRAVRAVRGTPGVRSVNSELRPNFMYGDPHAYYPLYHPYGYGWPR